MDAANLTTARFRGYEKEVRRSGERKLMEAKVEGELK